MLRSTVALLVSALLVMLCGSVLADGKSGHAALSDSASKLAANATSLASTAKSADDRAARKKFAPAAQDLGDDLGAFARRAAKDVRLKTLTADATALVKDARVLVELADEIEDKDERKALRGHAALLLQGVESLGKQLAAAANDDSAATDTAPKRFTGLLVNNTDKCDWPENVMFRIVRDGKVVYKTQLVFPGKTSSLALSDGQYVIQVLETAGDVLGQRAFEAKNEGWQFASGCVKD